MTPKHTVAGAHRIDEGEGGEVGPYGSARRQRVSSLRPLGTSPNAVAAGF